MSHVNQVAKAMGNAAVAKEKMNQVAVLLHKLWLDTFDVSIHKLQKHAQYDLAQASHHLDQICPDTAAGSAATVETNVNTESASCSSL